MMNETNAREWLLTQTIIGPIKVEAVFGSPQRPIGYTGELMFYGHNSYILSSKAADAVYHKLLKEGLIAQDKISLLNQDYDYYKWEIRQVTVREIARGFEE
jgi:hypothetical protein